MSHVPPLLQRPVNHVCYSVPDIEESVAAWAALGVGPFLVMRHAMFDEVVHAGAPATFDHSAAFAKWGSTYLELNLIHAAHPPVVELGLRPQVTSAISHFGYDSADPEADSAHLAALGYPLYLYARSGPIEAWYHYVPALGHSVELHRSGPVMSGFWAMLDAAAEDWDGADPLREMAMPV